MVCIYTVAESWLNDRSSPIKIEEVFYLFIWLFYMAQWA